MTYTILRLLDAGFTMSVTTPHGTVIQVTTSDKIDIVRACANGEVNVHVFADNTDVGIIRCSDGEIVEYSASLNGSIIL